MRNHLLEEIKEQKALETVPTFKNPRKFKVVLHNDDYTPMEFVVEVLQRFFHLKKELAVQTMLQIHTQGKGVCGVFTHEIAETKVVLVSDYARSHEHPLLCRMEPD